MLTSDSKILVVLDHSAASDTVHNTILNALVWFRSFVTEMPLTEFVEFPKAQFLWPFYADKEEEK